MLTHRFTSAAKQAARRFRRGAAMMTALFVMTVSSVLVISIMDTETLQYSALRNTLDWDRARYLAEAGLQHALAELEADITWRTGISNTQFPAGSGNLYWATAVDGATVIDRTRDEMAPHGIR